MSYVDAQFPEACDCRRQDWLKYNYHPEPYIANAAGNRYEYLRCNPCIHMLVLEDLFRRAEYQFHMIRYFRRKASLDLITDALGSLGPVLYNHINQFVRLTVEQLEDLL